MSLPSNFIRGIPNATFLNEGGSVGAHLFYFDLTSDRDDGWIEQSINWEDDDSTIEFTMQQRKSDGELQFKTGVVVVPKDEIEKLNSRPTIKGLLSFERRELIDNPYHGNLLLRSITSRPTMKLIAAGIALAVERIIQRAE